jgi:hypothetical protein
VNGFDVPISLPSDPASARPPARSEGRFTQDDLRPFPLIAGKVYEPSDVTWRRVL